MTILVIGASGKTGKCVVEAGITRSYQVHVFVRDSQKIDIKPPLLKVIQGDAMAEALQSLSSDDECAMLFEQVGKAESWPIMPPGSWKEVPLV